MEDIKEPVSRRTFIERLSSVGGVSLAMAGMDALGFGFASAQAAPPPLSGASRGKTIVILGAGLAGLTAAYELAKLGYKIKVLEARTFAGGRSQTIRRGTSVTEIGGDTQVCAFDEGHYLNPGPWRIPHHHQSVLHYTREFGVLLEAFVNDNESSYVFYQGGKGPLAGKAVRKQAIAADVRGYAAELLAKVARKGALDDQFTADDREQFIQYLIREGYLSAKDLSYTGTDGRGLDKPLGAGLDPGPGKPSVPYALADILHSNTWRVLQSVSAFDMPRTMFQPAGGMDSIARAFAKRVDHLISYSTVVEKISQNDAGVEVSYVKGDRRATLAADYAICTIPLPVLRGIDVAVSPEFKEAIGSVAYSVDGKIGLQMKRRFWEEDHGIYGGHVATDERAIGVISFPTYGWQGRKGVVQGFYNHGAEATRISGLSPRERADLALDFGQKIFPEYRASFDNAFSFFWHKVEYSRGGWSNWREDARKAFYPRLLEPDGRVYLAGEHLTYLNGWQAGAIESAWQQIEKLHRRVNA